MKTILLEMMRTEATVNTINFIDNNQPATSKTIASLVDKAVQRRDNALNAKIKKLESKLAAALSSLPSAKQSQGASIANNNNNNNSASLKNKNIVVPPNQRTVGNNNHSTVHWEDNNTNNNKNTNNQRNQNCNQQQNWNQNQIPLLHFLRQEKVIVRHSRTKHCFDYCCQM
jgi:hypothetical protein